MKGKHTDLVQQCLEVLKLYGVLAWPQPAGEIHGLTYKGKRRVVRLCPKGTSDIGGVLPGGRYIAVECKVGRDEPKTDQRLFLNAVTDRGGVGLVIYDDVAHLAKWLEACWKKEDCDV